MGHRWRVDSCRYRLRYVLSNLKSFWYANFYLTATYLNGRGVGSRYDGTYSGSTKVGSCTGLTGKSSSFSSSYKTFLGQYWQAQVETYEAGQGWIQWVRVLVYVLFVYNVANEPIDMES